MKQKGLALIVILIVSLLAVGVVAADAPAAGTVVEGASVPGAALGDTRAQVEAAYGPPNWCQSVTAGDRAFCSYPVSGGGQVDIHYGGADGGNAGNSPDDVARKFQWSEAASGWTTTAGINTALAKADPDAVVAAYPNAQVTYNTFGDIYSVIDHQQGIQIFWYINFYTGTVHTAMAITEPAAPPPQPVQATHVEDISLTVIKQRGTRSLVALVQVQNQQQVAAAGATVAITWTLPDGKTVTANANTSGSGYAYFELGGRLARGDYTLTVDDIVLSDHIFDREASQLTAVITVR